MSAALQTPMTLAAFLDWESGQALKYEFDGFRPIAMTGGTAEHSRIQINLAIALGTRLRGSRCQVFNNDLKVSVAGSVRYPDAFVVCTPLPRGTLVVTDPVVVFEILSPSTSYTDRIEKYREYRLTPSVQRYVILEQTRPAATVFTRVGEAFIADALLGDAELAMPEIGVTVPLAEFFEGIAFPEEPGAA